MTKGLLTSLKVKIKLYHRKLEIPTAENIEHYKSFLNNYNKLKKQAKILYYHEMIEINKNNIKNTWIVIKEAIGKTNNKTGIPSSFMINDKLTSNLNEKADSFNSFFCNIGKSTSENIPETNKSYANYLTILH